MQGGIGASLAGGSVLGSLVAGSLSDRWGRRDTIAFGCLWWMAGTAIQVATNGVASLIGTFLENR